MRQEMAELKKVVYESAQNGSLNADVLNDHKSLFNDVNAPVERFERADESYILDEPQSDVNPISISSISSSDNNTIEISTVDDSQGSVRDIQHEIEDESLSIEAKEKELIIKALKKNKNKRKYAAQDLGISERTLYRKIKQYEI